MLDFSPPYKWLINILIILGIVLAIPSLVPKQYLKQLPNWVPQKSINLGLDLAGGSHLLFEGDAAQLAVNRLDSLEDSVRDAMRRSASKVKIDGVSRAGGKLSFIVTDTTQIDAAREALLPIIGNGATGRDWDLSVVDGNRIVLSPASGGDAEALDQAMETATEVIRVRMGTLSEATIIRQGGNRIVVQVPGLQDPKKLKEIIGKTAKLEFKLVDDQADPDDVAKGIAPIGSQILPYAEGGSFIAVRRLGGISGEKLVKADPTVNPENQPAVSIQFDTEGGQKFARMTQKYTGKLFAIILDGKVISAPQINEPILGGQSIISGSFSTESANQLAISLRSGALPINLKVVEERSVGPDLGADSVRRGALAAIIGTVAILVLMLVTYGRFGMYANLALIINIAMILSIMAISKGTLTLPGIAGFVLTIGAAVDANVLIYERIREELKRGRRALQAVENGYSEASRAIFDANITNVIAAAILSYYGSGPIRGFAIVLMIGIATSVFTAVVITRLWVSNWLKRTRPQELLI
jgi:preprotein translocase subunit SecD